MYNTATFAVTILSTFSCWVRFCSCHFSLFFHMFWYVIIMYFACRNYQRERDRLEILLKISELSRTAFLSFPLLVGLTILGNFVFYKGNEQCKYMEVASYPTSAFLCIRTFLRPYLWYPFFYISRQYNGRPTNYVQFFETA